VRARRIPLRVRLAVVGLVGVLLPLAVLLVVAAELDEQQVRTAVDGSDGADAVDGVVTERTRGLSPWVPATAAVLALPAAVAAWWWAGRAVVPLRRIAAVADEIQATSLDRRIGLLDAPPEVQALAGSFDRMLDRLGAAASVQQRLVEDASHQLRTPLAVLLTNAEVTLADPDAPRERLRRALTDSRDAAERLRGVIDDLLVTARTEHRAATRVAADLAAIARDAAATYAALAGGAGVELVVRGPERLPAAADGSAVARAVASLVENAIRHSSPGGTVVVHAGGDDAGPFVAVADEGPGVDPAHRDRIFDRYWTTDGPDERGLGIGLAVVRQVAEAHEGVTVDSPLGPSGGTRFTLRFRA
jgi:signal transduction histidine kinase